MVRLTGTISKLDSRKILVAGDLMLDTYTFGKARRISPEAPVAVVQVIKEEARPGGAGNVVLNLISLGATVRLLGRVGNDPSSSTLCKALKEENVDLGGLFIQQGFSTPTKNRIIADNQQIVRVDHEVVTPLPEMLEQEIIEAIPSLLEGVEAVAISDYGKGFLSRTLLAAIIDHAKSKGIPVITDPKGIDFSKYSGTDLIKPNLSEAYAAAGVPPETPLDIAAGKILDAANADKLMVTRSEAGISVFHRGGQRQDFPVRAREIKDVTGAGDTVLAMLAFATANGLDIAEAAQLSNVAAGISIETFGCARVSLSEVARRLLELDSANKVFDDEHLFALKEALKGREYSLLGVPASREMTPSIYYSIHKLAKSADRDVVVYLNDDDPSNEFIASLASLHDVKFIILQGDHLSTLSRMIPPAAICTIGERGAVTVASVADLLKMLSPASNC